MTHHQFVTDNKIKERVFRILDINTILCWGQLEERFIYPDNKGNIVHTAFVTCWARLHLYNKLLQPLRSRVLYLDTDSCLFICLPGEWKPSLGNCLGELTDVLEDDSLVIANFCSGGPKNYGYIVVKKAMGEFVKCELKVRCISINKAIQDDVNFQTLQTMILDLQYFSQSDSDVSVSDNGFTLQCVKVPKFNIKRGDSKNPFYLEPREIEKTYRLVFDKSICELENFSLFSLWFCKNFILM